MTKWAKVARVALEVLDGINSSSKNASIGRVARAGDAMSRLSRMGISVKGMSLAQLDAAHQAMRGIKSPMDLTESTPEDARFQKELEANIDMELTKENPDDPNAYDRAIKSALEKAVSKHVDREYEFEDRRATNQARQMQTKAKEKLTPDELEKEKARQNLAKAVKVQKATAKSVAKQTGKPTSPPLARRSLLAPAPTLADVHPSTPSKVEKSATLSPYGHMPQERRRSLLDDPNPATPTIVEKMAARQRARQAAIESSKNNQSPTSPERYSANDYDFEDARANNQARQMAEEKARRDRENASKGGASNSGTNRGGPGMGGSYGGGGDGFDPSGRFHQGGLIDDGDPSGTSPAHPIIAQEGEFVLSRKAVTSLGSETVAHLNALATSAPHRARRLSEALNRIAGGPPEDITALEEMLLDDRYDKGQPGERDDYYAKVRREFKLVYPGDGQGRPILFDGGLIDDGDARTDNDDYPIRAPEGAFVLSRRAVAIFGPHLLNRINAASLANDTVLIKAVKKALAGMYAPIAA